MSVETFNALLSTALLAAAWGALWPKRKPLLAALVLYILAYLALPSVGFAALGTLALCLALSAPLFVTLGLLCLVCFYFGSTDYPRFDDYQLLIEKIFTLTDKNVLLAIPFFVVAGSVMTAGGIARRIIAFAEALVGWLPGGLAAATVCSCAFFAAISGSSPVTVIAIGSVLMPALISRGYPERFSLGLVTSAGSLGILIPPSIPMILYAIVVVGPMGVDVADLFLAGLAPGALIALLLIVYSVYCGSRQADFRWSQLRPPKLAHIGRTFREGFWALLLPVLILGGIYPLLGPRGIFTPTEAAAVSAVYALAVELYVHRELSWKRLPSLLVDSSTMMGTLLIIMILSFSLNHYFVDQELPDRAVRWVESLQLSRAGFLLALNLLLLAVGCLMDIVSAVLVVAPLIAPIAHSFEIAPLHLAIVFVVNLEIGYLTPPVGMNLFVSASLFQRPVGHVTRATLPFTGLMLLALAIVTWFEGLTVGWVDWVRDTTQASSTSQAVSPTPSTGNDSSSDRTERPAGGLHESDGTGDEELEAPGDDDDDEPGADEGRVLSIEELMKQAAENDKEP